MSKKNKVGMLAVLALLTLLVTITFIPKKAINVDAVTYKSVPASLVMGLLPDGYVKQMYSEEAQKEKVYTIVTEHGSAEVYPMYKLVSPEKRGVVYRIVNTGKEGFRIPVQKLEYNQSEFIKAFGEVRLVSMEPYHQRLEGIGGERSTGYLYMESVKK